MNLIERDKKFIWHPFTPQKNMQEPLAIVKAKDSLLFDEHGTIYIDAISSWWVTLHGHANKHIAQSIYTQALQLEQVIFAGFTHKPAIELAEKILQLLPGNLSKIFYSDDGSTSTEVAIKMAIQYWWNKNATATNTRTKILAFKNAYHGDTFGAMSVSDRSVFTLAFHGLFFEVIFIDTPSKENLPALKKMIAKQSKNIAAFIYEPLVQGAGGMKMYAADAMSELLSFIKKQHIICIADEVMTGFGRTGKLFASAYIQEPPDIICLSKGLTGGTLPLGITACSKKIYDAYVQHDKRKTFFHGHSFTANPLACSAALASVSLLLKKKTLSKIEWIEKENRKFAKNLFSRFTYIKNIRVLGTILAFEVNKGKDEYLNNIAETYTQQALANGVYLRPLGNTVYIMPPYCITQKELKKIYKTIFLLLR